MRKAFFQLHIAVFLAGFTGVLGRLIELNEAMIVWYRLLLTAGTMWVLFLLTRKIKRIPLKDIVQIAGVGVIAALHWVTFYAAIKYANVSVALVCFSAVGFFTAIFEPIIFRHRFNRIELLLGLITIAAIYLIFHFDSQFKLGIVIGLISAALGALFPVFNRRFVQRINVETMLAWQLSGGFVALSALLPLYFYLFPGTWQHPSLSDWGWLLVLAWFCSVIAFQLSSQALKKLSAFTVNLTYNLEPVYGILLAFALYQENKYLGPYFYIGFAMIMIVLLVHAWLLRRAQQKALTHPSVS
ncbi:MAG: DMT family transporter [Chitinophagaceae bacterium]|nr:DMT family transporter [Chitinophagaceae bacterium]